MHDIFYFTDIHGMYDLYRAMMDYCITQDPECMIIYGGDACDRGRNGYKIMQELLDDSHVLYLKGNHEDLFVQAARAIIKDYKGQFEEDQIWDYLFNIETSQYGDKEIQLCLYNGGYWTLHDWMMDGMPSSFIARINALPITFSYENIDFCHAGCHHKIFDRVAAAEYNQMAADADDIKFLIWDRNYLGNGWKAGRICVYGHTPTSYLAAKYYRQDKSLANAHPCSYIGMLDDKNTGKKIDMDTGACANGRAYVLNCLTMKAQGFRDIDINKEEIHKHVIEKIDCIQM